MTQSIRWQWWWWWWWLLSCDWEGLDPANSICQTHTTKATGPFLSPLTHSLTQRTPTDRKKINLIIERKKRTIDSGLHHPSIHRTFPLWKQNRQTDRQTDGLSCCQPIRKLNLLKRKEKKERRKPGKRRKIPIKGIRQSSSCRRGGPNSKNQYTLMDRQTDRRTRLAYISLCTSMRIYLSVSPGHHLLLLFILMSLVWTELNWTD